jgi:O-antigen ligase
MSTLFLSAPRVDARWRRFTPRKRAVPGLLLAVWGALMLNAHSYSGGAGLLPIPEAIGKLVTQGALAVALVLVLVLNRRGLVRPNAVLLLLTILAILGLMVSIHNDFVVGSTYRAVRFAAFLGVLWLLTPWWGRSDMILLRCHRRVVWIFLATVLVGAVLAPGMAFSFDGRLAGVLWPIAATQVGHLAAVLFTTSLVLWICKVISGRNASVSLIVAGALLVATHTRTAMAGTLIGLTVAIVSLFLGHVRARRVTVLGLIAMVLAASVFASGMTAWALRGQTAYQASQLTGRTEVWSQVLDARRPKVEDMFGSGLSNQSFNGLPIDSTWVGVYVDQGVVGVVILATVVIVLLLLAATQEPGPRRAIALCLVSYCMVASVTETGLGAATPYQLDLIVAAALLAPSAPSRGKRAGPSTADLGNVKYLPAVRGAGPRPRRGT